jgi:hypothetical protein
MESVWRNSQVGEDTCASFPSFVIHNYNAEDLELGEEKAFSFTLRTMLTL